MAYLRRCRYCNDLISMRQMPRGQWVAFDAGFDGSVHACGRPRSSGVLRDSIRTTGVARVPSASRASSSTPVTAPDREVYWGCLVWIALGLGFYVFGQFLGSN